MVESNQLILLKKTLLFSHEKNIVDLPYLHNCLLLG